MGNLTDRWQVQHIHAWVADGLAKKQFGVGLHCLAPSLQITRRNEGGLNAKSTQCVVQQIVRATIQGRRRHDVRARAHEGGDGQMQGRLTAGCGNGANAAL